MAKKFDRSAFKDTITAAQLKAEDQKIKSVTSKSNDNGYVGYHTITEGLNRYRIYPAHPNDEGHSFIVPVQRWWLSIEVVERDENGKEKFDKKTKKPIMKMVRKRVFDGRIHSKVERDIVDEYIKFLTKILKEDGLSETEVQEKLLPINGSYAKKINGIVGKPEWMMYADHIDGKTKTFGKLPVGKAVKMRINDIIAREGADEPLGSESNNPFTDPDDGRLLEITYDENATRPQDYYKTEINSAYDKVSKMIELHPLSDEDLEAFMEHKSLAEQYINCYTTKDFDLALEGLKNLDKENNYGVFEYDEFLDICEELSGLYPEPDEVEKEGKEESKSSTKKFTASKKVQAEETEEEEEEVEETDDINLMNRAQLKTFIKENECDIIVRSSMSDDDIRRDILAWQESDMEGDEVEEEEDDLPFDNPPKKAGSSAKDRIAALRNKNK